MLRMHLDNPLRKLGFASDLNAFVLLGFNFSIILHIRLSVVPGQLQWVDSSAVILNTKRLTIAVYDASITSNQSSNLLKSYLLV